MKLVTVISLITAVLVSACSGDGPVAPPQRVYGIAQMGTPVVGAQVEVLDPQGNVIATSAQPTGAGGSFMVVVPAPSLARFRVVVRGGTHDGKPFQDRLLEDLEGFDVRMGVLSPNAVTTLIARYRDAHPGISLAVASERVKAFLQIPQTARAGFSVSNPVQDFFRHERMLQAAQSVGAASLAAYMDGLVTQIDQGAPSRNFSRTVQLQIGAEDAIAKLMKFLAKAIGDDTISLAFEHLMTALGIDGTAEILRELHEINKKLDELEKLNKEIYSDVKANGVAVAQATALDASSRIVTFQERFTTLVQRGLDEHAERLAKCLVVLATGKPEEACAKRAAEATAELKADIAGLRDEILKASDGVLPLFNIIRDRMLSANETDKGVFLAAREYLATLKPFDPPVPDERLVKTKDFYQARMAVATHLLVEANMSKTPAPDKTSANAALKSFDDAVATQNTVVASLRHKQDGTVLDQRTGLVWLREPISNLDSSQLILHSYLFNNRYEPNFRTMAESECRKLDESRFGGYSGWRLPTDAELHAVVKGGPNKTGDADGGSGIFTWLTAQGFSWAPGNGRKNQRGFLVDSTMKTAYFSSSQTGLSGWFWEALWDHGVDNACYADVRSMCEEFPVGAAPNTPTIAGAWCVTSSSGEGASE